MRRVARILARPRPRAILAGLFSTAIFLLALWVLHRTLGRFDFSQVTATARAYAPAVLVAALLLTFASYAALSGFDWLGLRHVGRPLPLGRTLLISYVSHAVSHNAGFAVLTGGGIRLRMYSAFGLGVAEVGGIVAFAGLTFALGVTTLASAAFILESGRVAPLLRLPAGMVAGLGWAGAAALALYFLWTALARRPLSIGVWRLATPSFGLALGQVVIASIDLALVAGALYVLLPMEATGLGYPAFVGLYVVATIAGTLSHVPGGLGVFEGALLLLLPGAPAQDILAALLIFRLFYNLLPLLLAALVLAVFELVQRRRQIAEPVWISNLGPALAALLVFGCGAVLLLSSAVPAAAALPDGLAEPAHLLSAAVAVVLMLLPWDVLHRTRWGYRAALRALALGVVLALLRGPDWTGAAVTAAGLALLAGAAPLFHCAERPPGVVPLPWLGAAAAVVLGAAWLAWHGDPASLRLLSFADDPPGARTMRAALTACLALASAAWASQLAPYGKRK